MITTASLLTLITLTALEVILGIDNVIFIAILVGSLRIEIQDKVRIFGLSLALALRILLLFLVSHIIKMKEPLFFIYDFPISGRTILLFIGGLFLIYKAGKEIFSMFEVAKKSHTTKLHSDPKKVILQIIFIDLVLSFDSIITAIGMTSDINIIIIAIVIAMLVMLFSSKSISSFVNNYPSIKVIALMFILFIGVFLVFAAFEIHINKGYLYFSTLFSCIIEAINISLGKRNNLQK